MSENKNLFSNGIMRRMRKYNSDITATHHSGDKDIERLEQLKRADEITQTVYDRERAAINEKIKAQSIKIKADVKKDLKGTLAEMRKLAEKQICEPPTPEMKNTLQLVAMLDNISPVQLSGWAKQMANCPLAMEVLKQEAEKHNQRIYMDDPESKLRALDILEGHLANFIANFNGNVNQAPFSVRKMLQYLQADDQYMGNPKTPTDTDRVNGLFWAEFVGISSPAVFDDPDNTPGVPKAQYFFSDVTALSAFIEKMTAGVSGPLVEDTTAMILANCPEQYGAAYRCYKASGEMIDINAPDVSE